MSDETIEQIVAWCCSCSQINPKWTNVCQNCGCIKENARDLVPEGYVKQSSNMSYNQAIDDAEQAIYKLGLYRFRAIQKELEKLKR